MKHKKKQMEKIRKSLYSRHNRKKSYRVTIDPNESINAMNAQEDAPTFDTYSRLALILLLIPLQILIENSLTGNISSTVQFR